MANKKNTKQKSSNNLPKIRPFWAFVALFGLVGGIWLYRSFAAVSAPQVYLTTNNNSSSATIPDKNGFTYGAAGDKIIACDWDGVAYGPTNGATVAAYRPSNSSFYISNNNASVNAGNSFQFGDANGGYIPVCGNWDGQNPDGQSAATVGLYNPKTATFSLASKNIQGGSSTEEFVLGIPGDVPIACDWNGDKITDLGLFRPSEGKFYLALKYQGKWGVFNSFRFGNAGLTDYPVCGNWNGKASTSTNEFSTVGVYRTTDAKFYLRNFNGEGPVDVATAYGDVNSFVPVVGNWTGTNQTFIGAYRPGNNAPTAPTNLKVNSASTSGISLSWNAASDDGGIKGYSIYRNGVWWKNTDTIATTYTDTRDLAAGKSYSYYVVAYDGSGTTGPQSNTVSASITKPAANNGSGSGAEESGDSSRDGVTGQGFMPGAGSSPGSNVASAADCNNRRRDMANQLLSAINQGETAYDVADNSKIFFYPSEDIAHKAAINAAREDLTRLNTRDCNNYRKEWVNPSVWTYLTAQANDIVSYKVAFADLQQVFQNGLNHVSRDMIETRKIVKRDTLNANN